MRSFLTLHLFLTTIFSLAPEISLCLVVKGGQEDYSWSSHGIVPQLSTTSNEAILASM
jgi:hypothetical protein